MAKEVCALRVLHLVFFATQLLYAPVIIVGNNDEQ